MQPGPAEDEAGGEAGCPPEPRHDRDQHCLVVTEGAEWSNPGQVKAGVITLLSGGSGQVRVLHPPLQTPEITINRPHLDIVIVALGSLVWAFLSDLTLQALRFMP